MSASVRDLLHLGPRELQGRRFLMFQVRFALLHARLLLHVLTTVCLFVRLQMIRGVAAAVEG